MSIHEIIRAWKDADYLASLSAAQRAALPAHPAGGMELHDDELDAAAGGKPHNSSQAVCTPLQVCRSQEVLSCPTRQGCFIWG